MEWFTKFWGTHGERIVFGIFALILAGIMHRYLGLEKEATVIVIGTATLCVNKMRGTNGKDK